MTKAYTLQNVSEDRVVIADLGISIEPLSTIQLNSFISLESALKSADLANDPRIIFRYAGDIYYTDIDYAYPQIKPTNVFAHYVHSFSTLTTSGLAVALPSLGQISSTLRALALPVPNSAYELIALLIGTSTSPASLAGSYFDLAISYSTNDGLSFSNLNLPTIARASLATLTSTGTAAYYYLPGQVVLPKASGYTKLSYSCTLTKPGGGINIANPNAVAYFRLL